MLYASARSDKHVYCIEVQFSPIICKQATEAGLKCDRYFGTESNKNVTIDEVLKPNSQFEVTTHIERRIQYSGRT